MGDHQLTATFLPEENLEQLGGGLLLCSGGSTKLESWSLSPPKVNSLCPSDDLCCHLRLL